MSRLELPDAGWAELANPRKVPERKRRAYIAKMATTTPGHADTPSMVADIDEIGDLLIVCLVTSWSYGDVTQAAIQDLPADAFDTILKACLPLAGELLPSYGAPLPKAPTENSSTSPTPSSMVAAASATNGHDGTS